VSAGEQGGNKCLAWEECQGCGDCTEGMVERFKRHNAGYQQSRPVGEWHSRSPLVRSTGYVVVELKAVQFKPEHLGQLNFYVSVVNDTRCDFLGSGLRSHPRQRIQERTHRPLCLGRRSTAAGRGFVHLRGIAGS
jgi:hypothetical protein